MSAYLCRCAACDRVARVADLADVPSCCGRLMTARPIIGRYSGLRECNSLCMYAVGPLCVCRCAGANHGAGHGSMFSRLMRGEDPDGPEQLGAPVTRPSPPVQRGKVRKAPGQMKLL